MPDCSKVFQSRPSGCEPYMIADDIDGIVTSELRTDTLGSNATGAGMTELDDAFGPVSSRPPPTPPLPPAPKPTKGGASSEKASSAPPPPPKDDVDIVVEDALVQNGALDPIVPDADAVLKAAAKVVDVAKTTPLVVKEETKGGKAAAPFQQMAGKCYATSVRKAGKDVEFGVTMCPLRQDGTCPTSRSDPSCVSVVAKISMHDIQPATFVKSA